MRAVLLAVSMVLLSGGGFSDELDAYSGEDEQP